MTEEITVPPQDTGAGSAPAADTSGASADWRTSLPEDYRGKFEEFKSPADVMKGYENALKMANDKIKVPDKPDDKDGWDKVYSKLGRPEAADKYDLGDAQIDESIKGSVLEQFHALGLNNQQASGLLSFYNELATKQLEQAEAAKLEKQSIEAETEFKKLWGDAFEAKQADLKNFVNQHADGFFDGKPERGNDIELVKFMNSLYEKFGKEGDMKGGSSAHAGGKDAIRTQISQLREQQSKVMAHGADYRAAQTKINALYVELAKAS